MKYFQWLRNLRRTSFSAQILVLLVLVNTTAAADQPAAPFQVSTFTADVTIPLNHRCMGVLPTKSRKIRDPLEARGFVLQIRGQKPVIVCAIDWCEIRNGAYDQWRDHLAAAADTDRSRVLVTSLHQHDAPVTDSGAAKLLREAGLPNELYDERFHSETIQRVAGALSESLKSAVPVTHIGTGKARVDRIASNRRVILEDGRVSFGRGSRSGASEFHRNAPEGEIDPFLRMISFWNQDKPVVALSVYATHPMSFYGQGEVSADFVGLARRRMQKLLPNVVQIYASGCSGDVTAGKYNDGSEKAREELTERLFKGMQAAWDATKRQPLSQATFRSTPLILEYYSHADLNPKTLRLSLNNKELTTEKRILAAMGLSSFARVSAGQPIDLPVVDFGSVQLLLFPGEAFVGYQLMAQKLRPDSFVVGMGYGESWTGYIPTNASFADKFHDTWLWVPPGSQSRIERALQRVLTP